MKTSDIQRLGEAYALIRESSKNESQQQFVAAAVQAKKDGKQSFVFAGKKFPVTSKEVEEALKGAKKKLDPVDDVANDKDFKDRKDKDIDNDGDVDDSDEYLHNRRADVDDAIDGGKKPAKKVKKESVEEVDEARQMKDPKKDSMVSKGGKTIVIDKSKEAEYLKKGWTLSEEEEGEEDEKKKPIAKKPVPAKDVKDEDETESDEDGDGETEAEKDEKESEVKPASDKKDPKKKKDGDNQHTSDKTPEISKIEGIKKEGYSSQFEEMWTAVAKLTEKRKESKGATEPEGLTDKESPKSKEFIKKHAVNKRTEVGFPVPEGTSKEVRSLVDMAKDVLAGKSMKEGENPFGDEPKSKEKNPHDARTKEAKAFLERMKKQRGGE